MAWVTVFLISFLIANFLVPNLLLVSLKRRLLDVPNRRSVHKVTSSRLGGVSFLPSLIVSVCVTLAIWRVFDSTLVNPEIAVQFIITIGATVLMYTIGLFDDVMGMKYRVKFIAQFISSSLIVASGIWVNNLHGFCGVDVLPIWMGAPFSILLIMFIMNAVNLIDGIDGLASGLSMVALFIYGVMFINLGEMAQSLVAFGLCGCLLAFFRYNVRGFAHKTLKIFMGDTGSLVTGTILSVCAIKLTQYTGERGYEDFPLLVAYSVLIVPCFDVIRVMISRKRRGKSMFLPDKRHIHHKFLALGLSARRSLSIILLISVVFTVLNFALYCVLDFELIVLIDILIFIVLNVVITRKVVKQEKEQTGV